MIQSVTVIGSGRAGSAIAAAAQLNGYQTKVRRHTDLEHLEADLILLAVPDAAIAEMVGRLQQILPSQPSSVAYVVHVSGAQTRAVLAPLEKDGYVTASVHPFQTIRRGAGAEDLRNVSWGIECAKEHQQEFINFVRALNGRPVLLRDGDAHQKRVYHAAAVEASNVVQNAVVLASELLTSVTLSPIDLIPTILRTAVENAIRALETGESIPVTGPVVRGDVETIQGHLQALPIVASDVYRHHVAAMFLACADGLPDEYRRSLQQTVGLAVPALVSKALVYIVRHSEGKPQILVFRRPDAPEVSPQIPKGTVGLTEDIVTAARREVLEETGIDFGTPEYLYSVDIDDYGIRAHICRVVLQDAPFAPFRHVVTGDGEDGGMVFEFEWMPAEQAERELIAYLGRFVANVVP